MRISADIDHPDYHPQFRHVRIFLEGAERSNVVFADEEGRHAVVHRLDENGKPVIRNKNPVFEDFWGAVRIEAPEGVDMSDRSFSRFACGGVHAGGWWLVGEDPEPFGV